MHFYDVLMTSYSFLMSVLHIYNIYSQPCATILNNIAILSSSNIILHIFGSVSDFVLPCTQLQ